MRTTSVYVVRHGACEGGAIFRGGRTDSASTANGLAQLQRALANLPDVTAVLSSPLQRCATGAQAFARARDLPYQALPDFIEIDFGDWEGKLSAQVELESPAAIARYLRDPANTTPPGAETLTAFHARVASAWRSLIARYCGQTVVLVTHGGVIRIIMAALLGAPLSSLSHLYVPHGSLSLVRYFHAPGQADWPQLLFFNGQPDHGD